MVQVTMATKMELKPVNVVQCVGAFPRTAQPSFGSGLPGIDDVGKREPHGIEPSFRDG